MTGLDPDKDEILEIFCLLTDSNLELLDEAGWGTVVHQPRARMAMMDEWCTEVHGRSGLTAAVAASDVSPERAADELLAYIRRFIPALGVALYALIVAHLGAALLHALSRRDGVLQSMTGGSATDSEHTPPAG